MRLVCVDIYLKHQGIEHRFHVDGSLCRKVLRPYANTIRPVGKRVQSWARGLLKRAKQQMWH